MKLIIKTLSIVGLVLVITFLSPSRFVFAQSSSTNYKLEESFFGTGGEVDATSSNYRSQQSAGALGVGSYASSSYDLDAGFVTQNAPFLEMTVTGGTLDLGTLDATTTSFGSPTGGTCSCSFTVRSYTSSAYTVVNVSQPPVSESGNYFTAKTSLGLPSTSENVEEFGFNLVANTTLGTFGANPVNIPDNSFADGQAETGYDTPNQFKFGVGDTIASSSATVSNPAIGQTNYTVSYIAKPSNTTAAGLYSLQHVFVVIATF